MFGYMAGVTLVEYIKRRRMSRAAADLRNGDKVISFKIIIKGVEEMNYRIEEKASFRIVGLREPVTNDAEEAFKCVPLFWQKAAPQIPQIISLMNGEPKGLLGVSTCNEVEGKQNYYYIAVASDKPVPDGMNELNLLENTWAVFPGNGTQDDIQTLQIRIVSEWLPTSGYE